MCSLLTDGGSRSAFVIHLEHSRVASVHAARAGSASSDRSWDLVMQMIARLVLLGKDLVYNYSKVHGGRTSFQVP